MDSENITRDYMNNEVSSTTDGKNKHTSVPTDNQRADVIRTIQEPALANIDKHPLNGESSNVYSTNSTESIGRRSISSESVNDTIVQNMRDLNVEPLSIPIVGYEVMEERARFTIYKLKDRRSSVMGLVVVRILVTADQLEMACCELKCHARELEFHSLVPSSIEFYQEWTRMCSVKQLHAQFTTFMLPILVTVEANDCQIYEWARIFEVIVHDTKSKQSWLVFRRYTDFVRLYSRVKAERPNVNLPLPGKRWFRDNFEPVFLEERVRGLQVFVNSIIKRLPTHPRVREFFCLDEPPQCSSYQPEVQAVYGALEDNISALRMQLRQRDATISALQQRLRAAEEKAAACSSCSIKQ